MNEKTIFEIGPRYFKAEGNYGYYTVPLNNVIGVAMIPSTNYLEVYVEGSKIEIFFPRSWNGHASGPLSSSGLMDAYDKLSAWLLGNN